MSTPTGKEQESMHTAAIWWTQLRDSEPSTDLLERWTEWMSADPAHARAFDQINAVAAMAASAPPEQRRQMVDEFMPRKAPLRRYRRPLAAVAALVAMAVGGWWLWQAGTSGTPRQYASAVAENRAIEMSDGTAIELGAASRLTARYAPDRRSIELTAGEAFFTVTHDLQRPFVVDAGALRIEDLGTAFNVRRTGRQVSVTVTEGKVRLSPKAEAERAGSPPDWIDLVAGQRAEYDPGNGAISVSSVDAGHAAPWRHDRLEFVDEPLSTVLANVNRYSHHPVQLADPRLGRLRFTGTVNTTTIDSWVDALPHVFPVQVSNFPDHVVLSSAERR